RPWFVLSPEQLGVFPLHLEAQPFACRRGTWFGENGETLTASNERCQFGEILPEIVPGSFRIILAALDGVQDDFRAVRIVKIEYRRLAKEIGRAVEAGHVGIAFELGRASVVGRGDERNRSAAP